MNRLAIATLTGLLLSPTALPAAEARDEGSTPEEPAREQQTAEAQRDANASQDGDVFVPTDEISEDLSVSYPVDI